MNTEDNASRAEYIGRINRVVNYIDTHLAEPLSLETLADVAHFSPFHFHRLFTAITCETLADCIRRRRLEIAATRLICGPREAVLNIALDVGFGSAEVFSRNFRQHFGATPTAWRRGAWQEWAASQNTELSKIRQADRKDRQAIETLLRKNADAWHPRRDFHGDCNMEVTLKDMPETFVAYLRHVGPYGTSGIPATWNKLNRWCMGQGFGNPPHDMYGIALDDPCITPPTQCRYDACVQIGQGHKVAGEVGTQTIPGGLYACARFKGGHDDIGPAWRWMLAEWLPGSGYQCDARPYFELYPGDINCMPEPGIYLCEICIPIKKLG